MKYFISIALSPEQYCIGIALTEWVTKWSKEYFISIALHSIALAHLHVIFNTNKILMQYCILLVLHYSIALASFFCLGSQCWFIFAHPLQHPQKRHPSIWDSWAGTDMESAWQCCPGTKSFHPQSKTVEDIKNCDYGGIWDVWFYIELQTD